MRFCAILLCIFELWTPTNSLSFLNVEIKRTKMNLLKSSRFVSHSVPDRVQFVSSRLRRPPNVCFGSYISQFLCIAVALETLWYTPADKSQNIRNVPVLPPTDWRYRSRNTELSILSL